MFSMFSLLIQLIRLIIVEENYIPLTLLKYFGIILSSNWATLDACSDGFIMVQFPWKKQTNYVIFIVYEIDKRNGAFH